MKLVTQASDVLGRKTAESDRIGKLERPLGPPAPEHRLVTSSAPARNFSLV